MKYLVLCEGQNELAVLNILLKHDRLIFGYRDLLGLTPYHARQLTKNATVRTELNLYPENDVVVLRVGDKQKDKLKIPKEYEKKIIDVRKYCTLPELEILLIISEGLESEYEKCKTKTKAKTFAKQNVKLGSKRYDNSSQFYNDFYGADVGKLVRTIRKYKKINGAHQRDELYLADLLKV